MLKRLLLVALVALIGLSTASAQFNKAELNFLNTPFKVQMSGDALVGVRVDGKPNTFGLPSVKDFVKKFSYTPEQTDLTGWLSTVTLTNTGCTSIYDLCSNGSPVSVWQDPTTPANIHAVFVTAPLGDGTAFPTRRSKYYYSTDFGATWSFISEVPAGGVRSGFPTLTGMSDGTALIGNHSDAGTGTVRGQSFKDLFPGLGSFTRLDAPGNVGPYIWVRSYATSSLSIANKFMMIGSMNGSDTCRWNTCTNVDATPGTWLGWNTFPSDQAETYALGRGADGRIGLIYKNDDSKQPTSYGDVWFMESTNAGTSFGAPVKIFDANFGTDSLGVIRGVAITYSGNNAACTFETVKQTEAGSFFPGAPAKIRFWSPILPGTDPNKSVVIGDTTLVGWHPYVGVNDVLSTLCRPTIGVSSDGAVLCAAFMVPSDLVGGAVDTTTFGDIYITVSGNGGLTWKKPQKLTPESTPANAKDWRYISISPWNDKVGSDYYFNFVCLRGYVPGSYVNSAANGESLEEYWSIRAKVLGPVVISPVSTEVPSKFSLNQNFPNPFNPTTNIKFAIAKAGFVSLKIYDLAGREVSSLVNDNLTAGSYDYNFNASHLSSGIYFYTLRADGFTETKKMMLIK